PDPNSALEATAEEQPGIEDDLRDTHSQPVAPLDVHSVPLEVAPSPSTPPLPLAGEGAPVAAPTAPARPVVQATVQATHAAVSTAKQATNQVTAAVQQKAQKITVAPRKALYR